MILKNKKVLVTGGASFIGSHLVDALVAKGASVRVADDLSSGNPENLREHLKSRRIELLKADLRDPDQTRRAVQGMQIVFHLAAAHGGRGYVDLHQAACAENLMLDGLVFRSCREAGVEKIVYASSGCIYPNHLQTDPKQTLYLTEEMAGPPYDADNLYGWAKLMGEMTLRAFAKEYGMKTASCRYFTVYGPRGIENHAVIAMIARAFLKQDPFEVWGDGCLLSDGHILSNPGIREISELCEKDRVLGSDGRYQPIVRTRSRHYLGELVTLKPLGMLPLRLTSEHPVLITRLHTQCNILGKNQPHRCKPNCWCLWKRCRPHHKPHAVDIQHLWVPASEVRVGDFVRVPRIQTEQPQVANLLQYAQPKCSRKYLPKNIPLDEDFAYFLGWYTAEGWTVWQRNRHNAARKAVVALALSHREAQVVKKLVHCIRRLGFRPHTRKRSSAYEVSFSATHLSKWLDDHVGKGAHNKRVAPQIFLERKYIIQVYLDALFRDAGWKSEYAHKLTSVSQRLLEEVQVLLAKVGKFGWVNWFTKSYGRRLVSQGVVGYANQTQRQYWLDEGNLFIPIQETGVLQFSGRVYNIETRDQTFCTPILVHNSQIRNWTYVGDIVEGTILAAEKINDGTAVNLGTMERIRVIDAVRMVLDYTGHKPKLRFRPEMPTGPLNRVADNSLAKQLLGWTPQVKFAEGLRRTVDWYFSTKDRTLLKSLPFDRLLTERGGQT